MALTFLFDFFSRDLRARLELAVDHLLDVCCQVECKTDTDCTSVASSSGDGCSGDQLDFLMASPQVTSIVRKELAIAIRDLMHHGLIQVKKTFSKSISCL